MLALLVDRGYTVSVWEYDGEWSRFGVRKGEVVPGRPAPRLTISARLERDEADSKEGHGGMETQQRSRDEEDRLVRGRLEGRPRQKLELLVVKLGLMAEREAQGTDKGALVDRLAEAVREGMVPPDVLQAFLATTPSSACSPEVLRSATVDTLSQRPPSADPLIEEKGSVCHEEPAEQSGTGDPPSEAVRVEGCQAPVGEEEQPSEESDARSALGTGAASPPAEGGIPGHIASLPTGGPEPDPGRDARLVLTLTHKGGDSYQATVLYGGPGRDPFYRVYEVSSIQEALDEVPAAIVDADASWSESPRYPKAHPPKPAKPAPKPKTHQPKPEGRTAQASRSTPSPSLEQASRPQQAQLDLFGS